MPHEGLEDVRGAAHGIPGGDCGLRRGVGMGWKSGSSSFPEVPFNYGRNLRCSKLIPDRENGKTCGLAPA